MRKLFYLLLLLLGVINVNKSARPTTYKIAADSVRIYTLDTTGAELILENDTKDTLGFLRNIGNGRTKFEYIRLIQVSDTSFTLSGSKDTVLFTSKSSNSSSISDTQYLSIINDSLYITKGNGVDLIGYLDNTDEQLLNINKDTLFIENGNYVLLPNTDTTSLSNRINAIQDSQSLYRDGDSIGITRGNKVYAPIGGGGGSGWSLTGNSINSSDFIGTVNDEDLVLKRNNLEIGRFQSNGALSIGRGAVSSIGLPSTYPIAIGYNSSAISNGLSLGAGAISSDGNIAIGYTSDASSGNKSIAIGNNTDATGSGVAIGDEAGVYSQTLGYSIAIGKSAQSFARNGIAIGSTALAGSGSISSIAIGESAYILNADSSLAIGSFASIPLAGGTFSTAIGHRATTTSTRSVILGAVNGQNGANYTARTGIGTTAPTSRLHVEGSLSSSFRGVTSSTTLTEDDYAIWVSANSPTITLPLASSCRGRIYIISNSGQGDVTISPAFYQRTNPVATSTTIKAYGVAAVGNEASGSITLISDGNIWINLDVRKY